ncbi:MAG: hypothetical protein QM500_09415 [Methylococcales bacterium]
MKSLINKTVIILGMLALNVGMVSPSYAGIDDSAKEVGKMVGRYNVTRNGMCKPFSTPYMNKYVKANDKFFAGRSWTAKNRYKRGKEEGSAEWNFVMAKIKKQDPATFANPAKLKQRCDQMDSDAKVQYEQIAMLGIYNS